MPGVRSQVSQIDYPAILEEAWEQHLAPRRPDAPTVISLFAGCGGSSLGYSMAGFRELLAVEWNDNAVETFKLNFSDVSVYHGDIRELTIEQCLKITGLRPRELDLLDGSPPCQGFSTAGKRRLNDNRNQLYLEFVRLLKGLKPKVFVMENVSGLVKGKMKLVFADIMRTLKASGYKVSCRLMNAMYFHVPQSRQRLIWIGIRDDLDDESSHPMARSRSISVREAFRGLEDYCDRELPMILKKYARIHPRDHWSTDIMKYRKIKGNTASAFSLKWAQWDKSSGTLPKLEVSLTGIVHPDRGRYLNLSEMKRLGGFPDEFVFIDRKKGRENIGNSVPPLFMRAIALHIRREILDRLQHLGLEPRLVEG